MASYTKFAWGVSELEGAGGIMGRPVEVIPGPLTGLPIPAHATITIEVSYASIVIAAAAPASLYFLIVFVSVHLQARKDGIKALPRAELPKFRPVFVRGWYYMIPIAALVYFLVFKAYPPGMAGIYTCGFVVVVSFFSPDRSKWLIPSRIMNSFQDGVTRWITIAAIIASVGIMIGALELSGGGASRHRRVPDPVRLRVQPGAF